jgi:D-alanyl-D-alanine carboxypeptidase/D-alanyl-D-alanine-endopeptidase (penicillin-binding protein 4)
VVAHVDSAQLKYLLRHMNVGSVNFFAEVLGKRFSVSRSGVPGTIAKGSAAIRGFAGAHGVSVVTYDSSGLSYSDRATAFGMVRLLGFAESSSWGGALKGTLPRPGEGTLEDRLSGVPLRAKTGTLDNISALSGWLFLKRTNRWARFSLLSSGFSEGTAKDIEDNVVRTLWQYGR